MVAGLQDPVSHSDVTLSPEDIADTYRKSYRALYGKDPEIQYIYNKWYQVNGETIHRITLMQEITRLQALLKTRTKEAVRREQGVVNRLIARLRGM